MAMYRNCNCEAKEDEKTFVTGNMPINMQVENDMDMNRSNCELRRKMANEIKALEFAITELALYLDTHKDDEKALCLHNRYCKECKELKDKYQKVYGPLTINYPCNKWRWLEEPWPSFGLGETAYLINFIEFYVHI